MKSVLPKYKDIDKVAMDAAEKIFSSVSSMQAPTISQVQTMLDLGVFKGGEAIKARSLIKLLKMVDERGHKFPGSYDGNKNKSEFICPNGHSFMMSPGCFKRGHGCPKCSGNCPKQAEEDFYKEVERRDYDHTGIYGGSHVKTEITCDEGHSFMMSPKDFKRGHGCPKCAGLCPIRGEENFHEDVKRRNYVHTGIYIDNKTKTELNCDKGHPFMMTPNTFKNGHGCPKCYGNCPIQAEERFYKIAKERNYEHTGIYIDTKTKTELTCDKNHKFMMTPSSFKQGKGCPICSNREKKYETFTSEVLIQLGVKFTREKYVKTAKTYRRIDFVLPDYGLFIEIDEKHHKDIIADIEREDNIIKALKGTSFERFEFVRISATQGKTFEERTKHIEQELYNIVIDRG